jgi:hypothetical protein
VFFAVPTRLIHSNCLEVAGIWRLTTATEPLLLLRCRCLPIGLHATICVHRDMDSIYFGQNKYWYYSKMNVKMILKMYYVWWNLIIDLRTSWETSNRLHAPAALYPGKELLVQIGIEGSMGPGAGLDAVAKIKFLTITRLELQLHGHPARSQSLYRLRSLGCLQLPASFTNYL